MMRSCALARGEGVTVYTIGAMPGVHTRWRDALVACSGAFRAIARRVISLRRVS